MLSALLAYRKLLDTLEECCGIPRSGAVQKLASKAAGWLWSAEYAAPAMVLLLCCWWTLLLLMHWGAGARLRTGLTAIFPLAFYTARKCDGAVSALIGLELLLQLVLS